MKKVSNTCESKGLQDKYLSKWIIHSIFIFIAILLSSYFLFENRFPWGDGLFNYFRLKDAFFSIIHGQLPQFNLFTGNELGIGINTFYPYLLFVPLILIIKLVPTNIFFTILYALVILIGMELSFYSIQSIFSNITFAFLSSVFYILTPIMLSTLVNMDISAELAYMLSSLSIMGWYKWINLGRWKLMCIGLILVSLSNFPVAMCNILIILTLTLLNIIYLNKSKMKSLLKSMICYFMSIFIITLPIIYLCLTNKIFFPYMNKTPLSNLISPVFIRPLITYFYPPLYTCFGLIDIISIIFGFLYFRYINQIIKSFQIIGILIIVINFYPIQEFLIQHTFLYHLQFLARLCPLGHFLLTFSFFYIICFVKKYYISSSQVCGIFDSFIIFALLIFTFFLLIKVPDNNSLPIVNLHNDGYISPFKKLTKIIPSHQMKAHAFTNKQLSLYESNYVGISSNYGDYVPKSIVNKNVINNHKVLRSGNTVVIPPFLPIHDFKYNGFDIQTNKAYKRMLPIVIYNSQSYKVINNNKYQKYQTKNHYIKLKLHKGLNRIRIYTPIMWYRWVALIVSVIGILLLFILK